MAISSPGIGSGLDVNSIVTKLIKAEGQAPSDRLNQRETNLKTRLSGYGLIQSSISSLQSSLGTLNNPTTFTGTSTSTSDSTVVSASATSSASVANYDIDVTALANSHKLSTDPALTAAQFTSTTDVLGTGSLTLKFGTTTYDKASDSYSGFVQNPNVASATIDITDGSLAGIRDAINNAGTGASASIVNDGSYYRLVIASDSSGADNSIQITANDNDLNNTDSSGLSLLSFNASSNNLEQTAAGADARLNVNGIDISSASNNVTGAVENVTLNLKTIGSANVSVSRNEKKISSGVQGFVAAYNRLQDTVRQLTNYDPNTRKAGALNGDTVVSGIDATLKRLLGTPVGNVADGFTILADIGITTDANTGKLLINQGKLDSTAAGNPEKVRALFSAFGATGDPLLQFDGSTGNTATGNYAVNITQLATHGELTGSAAANLTITANSNDSIDVDIDGIKATVKLTAGTYTASSLTAELQSQINSVDAIKNAGVSVKVTESSGVLSITSNDYGSVSSVNITGGNGQVALLGGAPTRTDGLDVAGTIGGAAATGNGQYLTGSASGSEGLRLLVTGTTTGGRGTVDFKRGFADSIGAYLKNILDNSSGILSSTTNALENNIKKVASDRGDLTVRLAGIEKRLRRQYAALDTLVSSMQNTSAFLTQQLASLPSAGGKK